MVNPLEVTKGREQEALAEYWKFAAYFSKNQATCPRKCIGRSVARHGSYLVTVAEWRSVEAFQAALQGDTLKKLMETSTGVFRPNPGLYEIIERP